MIPETLISRANLLLEEIGGLKEGYNLFSDEQILDLCLFNGYTYTIFPKYSGGSGYSTNNIDNYNNLDLIEIGYKPKSIYKVLDYRFNHIYSDRALKFEIGGLESYFYGLSDKDKAFLETTKHGEIYYIAYEDRNGDNLLQMIVSHKLPASIVKLNQKEWMSLLVEQSTYENYINEMLVELPNEVDNLMVGVLTGRLSSNYSENDIFYNPNSVTGKVYEQNYLYMTFKESSWISFREYREPVSVPPTIDIGVKLADLRENLATLSFQEKNNLPGLGRYRDYMFIKEDSSGWTKELTVGIDQNLEVVSKTFKEFRRYYLTDIEGVKTGSVKVQEDQAVFLEVGSAEPTINSQGGTASVSFLSKEVIKIRAKLKESP